MTLRNRVFPLTITALAPVHIDSGTRLAPDLDYAVDNEHTYVVDSDVALELVVSRWEAAQPVPEELYQAQRATLGADEERLRRRREQQMQRVEQFEQSPPKDPRKRQEQETRLRVEAEQIKGLRAQLKARAAELDAASVPAAAPFPDAILHNSGLADLLKTGWLTLNDMRAGVAHNDRPLVRYVLGGRPATGELYEQIKDIADRLYLPGSSLKGALRSALAWDIAASLVPVAHQKISQRSAKMADDEIEQAIFLAPDSKHPNNTVRDVLRTLHVGDSAPAEGAPALLAVRVFRSSSVKAPLAVESIPAGASFHATLQIERYPFESAEARRVLDFGPWQARLAPEALADTCRRRAAALIAGERTFFARFPEAAEVSRFYEELRERLAGLGPQSFMLPVGWGAGWRSKTLDDRLRGEGAADEDFATAVQRFNLKKHKSAAFRAGGSFPDTRKLALNGERPWRPLGWLQITIGEERR